jgi:protease-4
MKRSTKWFLGILGGLIVIAVLIVAFVSIAIVGLVAEDSESVHTSGPGEKVAVIELKGVITESEPTVRLFKKFRERKDVKSILFRVDSPGGGVVASQEIYEEVRKTREKEIPVVVSMGSVAASGGYYVSCGANRIVANRGTITGSIGVISQFLRFDPLMKKIGVEANTVKSGKFKDTGSPFREMTKEDRQYFQNLIDDVHRQFILVVEKERSLDRATALKYSSGQVFTGEQALEMKLVDTIGTYEEAISIAAELGGIRGEPGIVRETRRRPRFIDYVFGESRIDELFDLKDEILGQPILQYRFIQ